MKLPKTVAGSYGFAHFDDEALKEYHHALKFVLENTSHLVFMYDGIPTNSCPVSVVYRSDASMLSKMELRARIVDVLTAHHTMTLATIRPDGFPQATTVNYVNDDLVLYFATDARSQKTGNIKLNNKVSAAITAQTEDFYKLSGLSMSGVAQRITDKNTARKITVSLFQRMPQSRRFVPEEDQQVAVYSISPVAFSFIDYAKGFGTRSLLEL